MCREEIGVRQDSDGALHRMRVENRRLRALLRAFRNHWPEAEAEWLARELEATGRTLGAVRDLEVMSAASAALADRVPETLRAQMPLLEQWLAGRRSVARDEMLAFLRDPARLATLQRLRDAFARAAPPAATPAPLALAAVGARIDKTARNMRRRLRALPDDLPQEPLHELRLIGKRLRYLADEFAPWFADELAPCLRALTRLQQVLGAVCDHLNAADACVATIRTFGNSSRDPGAAAALLGGLATLHRQAARREQKRATRRLADMDRKKLWRAFSALAGASETD
jgi:CHAD domain-containing protein